MKILSASTLAAMTLAALTALGTAGGVFAQGTPAPVEQSGANQAAVRDLSNPPASGPLFTGEARRQISSLIVQDYQGRMKPLDTLAREMVIKVTKRSHFEGWDPLDLYLSWVGNPRVWFHHPLIAVRPAELRDKLGLPAGRTRIAAADLYDETGHYRLDDQVEEAHRTPDKDRTKFQRGLISFDERFHLFVMSLQGATLRIYPVPDDPKHTWLAADDILDRLSPEQAQRYEEASRLLQQGLQTNTASTLLQGVAATRSIQREFGADVLPSRTSLAAELLLNRVQPFSRVTIPYLLASVVLVAAYFWSLARRKGEPYRWRHPLYLIGSLLFWVALLVHFGGFVLRWIASGRAPLSNGYESLVFISLAIALAGFIFELTDRRSVVAGLSALLTAVVLGVSMMSTFDPAIGPLVPVLASYWLNIHVTVITASYGFLGLGFLLGGLVLLLYLRKGPGKETLRSAITKLDLLNRNVIIAGLALLSVGTLLGGVWANESWGRYWGWDAKETWAFVTIMVYAVVLHTRWIPGLNTPWCFAAGSFAGIASVVMTYFGVNYFLSGLHSYAHGEAAKVPGWVGITALVMLTLILTSGLFARYRSWTGETGQPAAGPEAPDSHQGKRPGLKSPAPAASQR